MSDKYGDNFIELEDDDGNKLELEELDTLDYNDKVYVAFVPADMDENDPDYGLVILRSVIDGDEYAFEDVDDENELQEVYDKFMLIWQSEDED